MELQKLAELAEKETGEAQDKYVSKRLLLSLLSVQEYLLYMYRLSHEW